VLDGRLDEGGELLLDLADITCVGRVEAQQPYIHRVIIRIIIRFIRVTLRAEQHIVD